MCRHAEICTRKIVYAYTPSGSGVCTMDSSREQIVAKLANNQFAKNKTPVIAFTIAYSTVDIHRVNSPPSPSLSAGEFWACLSFDLMWFAVVHSTDNFQAQLALTIVGERHIDRHRDYLFHLRGIIKMYAYFVSKERQ